MPSARRAPRVALLSLVAALALLAARVEPVPGSEAEPPEAAAEEAVIRIRVSGLRSDDGRVTCGLFVEENWLRAGAIGGRGGEIEDGVAVCRFPGVAPGTYAISTYHDENGNGELDTGFMRIPKEGTAASRNAFRRFGPPRYRDAKFDYDGGVLELEAAMRYLGGDKG